MDIPNKFVFFVVVAVLQLAVSNVAAMDYLVGDENGWSLGINYHEWAHNKFFRVGDRLIFRYTGGDQNVVRVKRDAYKKCMVNPASKALTSGDDAIELTSPGRKFFISSIGDQCSVGKLKLAITVFPSSYFYRKPYFLPAAPAPSPDYSFIWRMFFPPSAAPAPAKPYFNPRKVFFPPSAAPAPSPNYEFIWRLLFPPSAAPAPAPSFNFPWKVWFPQAPAPAPATPFPWKWLFPQAPAPAPATPFPWKWLFPQAPAPAPSTPFPWKWLFPQTPVPAPTMDFQEGVKEGAIDSSNE